MGSIDGTNEAAVAAMQDLAKASDTSILDSLQLVSSPDTQRSQYALDHLVFLLSGQAAQQVSRAISTHFVLLFQAFQKATDERKEVLSWIMALCSRHQENCPFIADQVLTSQNLIIIFSGDNLQVLANCGEMVGNVLQTSPLPSVEIVSDFISLLFERIHLLGKDSKSKPTEKLEKAILGVLLRILCRVEISRLVVESDVSFNKLLELASSSETCKPMIPIILSRLFSQFQDASSDQPVQDACLKCLNRWYQSGQEKDASRALLALSAIFQAQPASGSAILQSPGNSK